MGIMDREYMHERQRALFEDLAGATRRVRRSPTRWHMPRPGAALVWLVAVLVAATLAVMAREWSQRQPFPTGASLRWHAAVQPSAALLTLRAPPRGPLYWVSLHDWRTDQLVATIALRPGERVQTGFPLGQYRLRVATGQVWLGEARLFGLLTERREAEWPLVFSFQDGRWMGVRIDLDQALNGNLEMRRSW